MLTRRKDTENDVANGWKKVEKDLLVYCHGPRMRL